MILNFKRKVIFSLLSITFLFFRIPSSYSKHLSEDCHFLDPLLEAINDVPNKGSEIKNRVEKMIRISEGITKSSEILFYDYLDQKINPSQFENCFYQAKITDEKIIKNYNSTVSGKFFKLSLGELLKFQGEKVELFSKTLKTKSDSGELIIFKLVGHYGEKNVFNKKAGFHRGNHSIYMDFSKIPPSDWLLIFTHEYAHSLDSTLSESMPVFSDPGIQRKILSILKINHSSSPLSEEATQTIDYWLMAGLNRGFLAEVRAWALSFEIYEEMKKNKADFKIDWLEDILKQKMNSENWIAFSIRYLSPRFKDPTGASEEEGVLFKSPLILERLSQLRTLIDQGEIKIQPLF